MKKIFSLENYSYLVILLLPAYLLRLNIFGVPTNVLELLILGAVIGALVTCRRQIIEFLAKPGPRTKRYALFVGLILVGMSVSTLASGKYSLGVGIIKGWFILPIIFALSVKLSVPKEKLKNIYGAFYLSAAAVSSASLADYFLGRVTFDGRLAGFFDSPNYLAMYLAPSVIIGAAFFKKMKEKNFYHTIGYAISYAAILGAFYLTYSYAAWLAAAFSLAIVLAAKNQRKIKWKKFLLALAVVFFVLAASQWISQKFMALRMVSGRSSLASRIMIWKSAGKMVYENPILGIGPGNFQEKYLEYQKYFPPYLEWAVPHPHNLYLAFWLYSGIVGLAAFILLLYFWLREIFAKEKDALWLASVGIMLYFLLHGIVDTTYFKNDLAVIFWLNFLALL